jgi:hypothetical protein
MKLMIAAHDNPKVGEFIIRGFDDAGRLMPYWFDEAAADQLIAQLNDETAKEEAA